MLAIKFKPVGKKHQGSFRVVVGEKRSKLRGVFIEDLGWFNPQDKTHHINKERAQYWLSVGAQATSTVHNLLVRSGAVHGSKIAVHKTAKKSAVEKPKKYEPAEKVKETVQETKEEDMGTESVGEKEEESKEDISKEQSEADVEVVETPEASS